MLLHGANYFFLALSSRFSVRHIRFIDNKLFPFNFLSSFIIASTRIWELEEIFFSSIHLVFLKQFCQVWSYFRVLLIQFDRVNRRGEARLMMIMNN